MYINKISITNFKSIYDTLELDFDDIKGFWKISGSVGAGKTTVGEAIMFGLFGTVNGKNNGDLISWGQKHGKIETWCVSKGRNIHIIRELNAYGQSPVTVYIDGEEMVFTNKRDAQSQLEKEYYDISRVTLELLCVISFNNFKSLATLNTQDTKKFLDQVLGFYTLTEYSDICKELRSNTLADISSVKTDISHTQSQITKLEEMSSVKRIEGDIQLIQEDIERNEQKIRDAKNELDNSKKSINSRITEYTSQLKTLELIGKNLSKEIKFIESGKCPTCGADIDQTGLEDKKAELEQSRASWLENSNIIRGLNEQLNKLDIDYRNVVNPIKEYVTDQKRLQGQLYEQSRRKSISDDEINNLKSQIDRLEESLNGLQSEDQQWEALYNILNSDIRAKILESFIPILNHNILTYTQRLQQSYIIQFDSNFKCSISICGVDNTIPISSLSTGQLKTVDMIIILGVLGTIIGSSSTNIMFLDELFSNLDNELRNDMCKILKESVDKDKTLFIISHQDLDEQYFEGNIHMKLESQGQFERKTKATIKRYNHDM